MADEDDDDDEDSLSADRSLLPDYISYLSTHDTTRAISAAIHDNYQSARVRNDSSSSGSSADMSPLQVDQPETVGLSILAVGHTHANTSMDDTMGNNTAVSLQTSEPCSQLALPTPSLPYFTHRAWHSTSPNQPPVAQSSSRVQRTHEPNTQSSRQHITEEPPSLQEELHSLLDEETSREETETTDGAVYPAYSSLERRIQSFRDGGWQQENPSVQSLVVAGFFYYDNKTTCFMCGTVFADWQPTDVPANEHMIQVPACAFVMKRLERPY